MNAGRLNDAIQYQLQLQQNLIYLGTVADEQPDVRKLAFSRADPRAAPPPSQGQGASTSASASAAARGEPAAPRRAADEPTHPRQQQQQSAAVPMDVDPR